MPLHIDYIEFTSPKLEETQDFFRKAFGWSFIDYGPDYRDIQGAGLGAGVERDTVRPPLVVLKSSDLEGDRDRLIAAGAELVKDIFAFPGGRRFEFREPGGTLMAVWSATEAPQEG
ncbi:MAG: VOC family protein [Pseudomonadota bacterium]